MSKAVAHSSAVALGLYRQIWRASDGIPVASRRDWIRRKLAHEYRVSAGETDASKVAFLLQLGEAHLDPIRVQAQSMVYAEERDPEEVRKDEYLARDKLQNDTENIY